MYQITLILQLAFARLYVFQILKSCDVLCTETIRTLIVLTNLRLQDVCTLMHSVQHRDQCQFSVYH